MLLAELEVWHTRPLAPTRRIALGNLVLPVDPAPGFGGLLLGAVVDRPHRRRPGELVPDVHRLIDQIDRDERVVQPRLRHRFQVDRHGLALSTHRLLGNRNEISFDFHTTGTGAAQVLGAIYAVERLDPASRRLITPVLHRAMRWRGPVGPKLIAHLAGANTDALSTLVDPRAWALDVLGFAQGTATPTPQGGHGPVPGQDAHRPSRPRRRPHRRQHRGVRARRGPPHPDRRGRPSGWPRALGDRRHVAAVPRRRRPAATSPTLVAVEKAVAPAWATVRADFAYRQEGRRAPDRPPKLLATVREELAAIARRPRRRRRAVDGWADVLDGGGGGRRRAGAAESIAGVVLISYPLHPPGKPDNLRVDHLPAISVPCLFVHGHPRPVRLARGARGVDRHDPGRR